VGIVKTQGATMSARRTLIFAVLLALPVTAGAATGARAISITMSDAVGDSQGGAADIRGASIRDDGHGTLTFRFDLMDRTALSADDTTLVFLDTDMNPATGQEGDDYLIFADGSDHTVGLYGWDGAKWAVVSQESLSTSDGLTLSIHHRDLGGTKELAAYFQTERVSDEAAFDAVGPVPFFVFIAPTSLKVETVTMRPTKPRAGQAFLLNAVIRTDGGEMVTEGSVACVATIGKKRVKTTWPGHFFKVVGQVGKTPSQASALCSWNVPAGSAGKTIRGSITVTAEGLTVTKTFSARISR
jgi:hypothetical protein